MTSDGQPRVRLEDYRPPAFLVDRVDLDVRLEPEQTRVRSRLLIRQNPARPDVSTLVLDGENLKLAAILLDRIPLPRSDYVVTDRALTIADAPDYPFELEITTIVDPAANTRLMGLYRSNGVYCTQCEAEGFRRITYFPDRPDVLSVFTTRVEARKSDAPILLANGNPVAAGEVPGSDRHFAVWHDPFPKPSYLFALVGGDLGHVADRFTTASGRDVRLGIYVERGKEDRCGYAMEALKRAMRWDEEAFGREYDLDVFNIVAVSDFNMGAMENKGLNVFNDKYILASPETATDVDYANIEAIIAHEYFHNWTGNRITCRDWFQLCLKEGLTVFRDQEFTSDMRSRPVKRISDVRLLRAHQFVEDAGPLAHPVRPNSYNEINNFYTATVYEKGAEVIRMLKVLLGEEGFRAGMNLYFTRHDGDAATIEDFLACFADATGRSLDHFKRWYFQAGTPQLTAGGSYDASARRYTLTLEQETPPTPDQEDKAPQHIPVAFALVGPDGAEVIPRTDDPTLSRPDMIELTEQRRTIVFEDVDARPVPSLLRGFSAPIKLTTDLTDSELLFLSGADGDPFNRWQAMQTVATRILVNAQEAIRANRTPRLEDGLVEAMSRCLTDPALDMAFQAQLLALPSELDIAREVGRDVDPDAIHAADSWLRRALAEQMAEVLDDIYRHHSVNAPYEPGAESAARRALRNAALMFLTAIPGRAGLERALAHYRDADNMTDRIGGLSALTRIDAPETEEALADFYVSHREDPLVLDKWLTLQATTVRADTLERVRKLMEHSAFSMSNPNRLRALVGAFATGNPTQFNRPDGEGFRLVADVVLDVDRTNPQVAARLLSAFKSWRALEAGRRAKAERELRRVAERDGLSRDVSDIVQRSLG